MRNCELGAHNNKKLPTDTDKLWHEINRIFADTTRFFFVSCKICLSLLWCCCCRCFAVVVVVAFVVVVVVVVAIAAAALIAPNGMSQLNRSTGTFEKQKSRAIFIHNSTDRRASTCDKKRPLLHSFDHHYGALCTADTQKKSYVIVITHLICYLFTLKSWWLLLLFCGCDRNYVDPDLCRKCPGLGRFECRKSALAINKEILKHVWILSLNASKPWVCSCYKRCAHVIAMPIIITIIKVTHNKLYTSDVILKLR